MSARISIFVSLLFAAAHMTGCIEPAESEFPVVPDAGADSAPPRPDAGPVDAGPATTVDPACPEEGLAAITVALSDSMPKLTADDQLIMAIFAPATWPEGTRAATGAPGGFAVVPSAMVGTPPRVSIKKVKPGDWVVYVCIDRGSDSLMGCKDGTDDLFIAIDGAKPITFAAGQSVTVRADVGAQTNEPAETVDASTLTCQ